MRRPDQVEFEEIRQTDEEFSIKVHGQRETNKSNAS